MDSGEGVVIMRKTLPIIVALVAFVVVSNPQAAFCQDLAKDLRIIISTDKDEYVIDNGRGNMEVKVELKNVGKRDLEIRKPCNYCSPRPLTFKTEPFLEIYHGGEIQNVIKPSFVILKSGSAIQVREILGLVMKDSGQYNLYVLYDIGNGNYLKSNVLPLEIKAKNILEIIIETDKKVYKQNEDILVSGVIKNVYGKNVELHLASGWLPRLEICSKELDNFMRSDPLKLAIIGGKVNYRKPYFVFTSGEGKRFRPGSLYIPKWHFPSGLHSREHPSLFANNGRLNSGRYTIKLVDFCYRKENGINYIIESNPVDIEILAQK